METTAEKLEHMESLLVVLIEGLKKIENKEVKFPDVKDYQPSLEEIKKHIDLLKEENDNKILKEQITVLAVIAQNLLTTIKEQKDTQEQLIKNVPKIIKVEIEHKITDRIRPYLLIFIGVSLALTLSLWGNYVLWENKSKQQENDIKFRAVRQLNPNLALFIDTLYYQNPDSLELKLREKESYQLAVQRASELAKEKKKEAEKSEKALRVLKGK
jgi:hypothetical protein